LSTRKRSGKVDDVPGNGKRRIVWSLEEYKSEKVWMFLQREQRTQDGVELQGPGSGGGKIFNKTKNEKKKRRYDRSISPDHYESTQRARRGSSEAIKKRFPFLGTRERRAEAFGRRTSETATTEKRSAPINKKRVK